HLAHSIQVDHILRVVERNTLPVIRNLPPAAELPAVPEHAVAVPTRQSGYVQFVNVEKLLAAAAAQRGNVCLRPWGGERGGGGVGGVGVAGGAGAGCRIDGRAAARGRADRV